MSILDSEAAMGAITENFEVFGKTETGTSILAATRGTLSPPARQLLILVDGQRSVMELAGLFGADAVEKHLPQLQSEGYITLVRPGRAKPAQPAAPAKPAANAATQHAHAPSAETRPAPLGLSVAQLDAPVRPPFTVRKIALLAAIAVPALGLGLWLAPPLGTGNDDAGSYSLQPVAPPGSPLAEVSAPAPAQAAPAAVTPAPALLAPPAAPAARPAAPVATPAATADAPRARETARPATPEKTSTPAAAPAAPKATAPQGREVPAPAAVETPVAPPTVALVDASASGSATTSTEPAPAAAATAPAPEAPVVLHARSREMPGLSRRARRAGITAGTLTVRLHVTATGTVEKVDVVQATPPQIYDSDVEQILMRWTFDPPGKAVVSPFQLSFRP